jgi:aminoglycoside phosphotransferase (APT) family kinase protein
VTHMTVPSDSPALVPAWKRPRLWIHFELHRRRRGGFLLNGHHHHNYVVELREPLASIVQEQAGRLGKFRTRLQTVQVIPRVWPEGEVLRALRPHLATVPRPLHIVGHSALHTYVEGVPLTEIAPPGSPVGDDTLRRVARLFGELADVPAEALPKMPRAWLTEGSDDSTGFLRNLAAFAHREVYRKNLPRFGRLFRELGIPDDAMEHFANEAKRLRPRPYTLLHTDIHRANLLRRDDGELALVDWEAALFGDPLHDLATHVVRMEYTDEECRRLIALWRREMRKRGLRKRLEGMAEDFRVYLDFEYAQSVFPDTMRAADALPAAAGESDFDVAAASVHRALKRAQGALSLVAVADHEAVKRALITWHRERQAVPWRSRAVRRGLRGR